MILSLNDKDIKKLQELLDIKEINIAVSNMFIEFCRYYDLVNIKKIEENKTTYVNEFLNYFDIDFSDEENKEIIEKYIKPALKERKRDVLIDNPYFKNIKFNPIKDEEYSLEYETYHPYQAFAYDDVKIIEDFREIYQIGYFKEKTKYPAIAKNDIIWMSVTPNEILTMEKPINESKGHVLTFGLGLGYYAYMVSNKKEVESVTIIEKDAKIINLFKKYILPQFEHKEKINIICADAFVFLKENTKVYDYVFVDIWHGANDGLPLYLKFKKYEANQEFTYWLEESILGLLRRLVLTLFEEYFENYTENDYKNAKNIEDKIINKLYFLLKDQDFKSIEEIKAILTNNGLKELIKCLK